ncbi:protein of unknown function [Candidatus Hydrogenisulfobacillus filiaventi]|uniref:Uncharacterized protein n=1 Tax=Candidatus Hydrogenisulfobacillus filiaventi TaxID=2707344 RepID=A0A6F8ZDB4_9FIRM|nr:protein of unknown function [Candidatus Hydrogenisulfobacillus filiaventi]
MPGGSSRARDPLGGDQPRRFQVAQAAVDGGVVSGAASRQAPPQQGGHCPAVQGAVQDHHEEHEGRQVATVSRHPHPRFLLTCVRFTLIIV